MFRRFFFFLLVLTLLFSLPARVYATYDPLSVPNNRFGIHVQSENDLSDAVSLVNSSGGDWGYVTLVIAEGERSHARWQKVFDEMRRKHLIPIVRLATKVKNGNWVTPEKEEINNWITFLNSINWVVKNRYVIIGNEPNHAKEWGGKVAPDEYADYLQEFSAKLKAASEDFFVMPGGLDASAPNSAGTMDETKFIGLMLKKFPNLFDNIDGWVSHSYPNPAFSGAATDKGRGTVRTFDWELSYLRGLGITKTLPVFITETGWSNKNLTESEIGERLVFAFKNVWDDGRIAAVTPFILNYTEPPFDEFSWKKKDGDFYSFFNQIVEIQKSKGEPIQEVKGKIAGAFINPFLLANSAFKGVVLAQNLGQSVWISPEITIDDESKTVAPATESFSELEPNKFKLIYFSSTAPEVPGKYEIPLVVKFKDKSISERYAVEMIVVQPAEVKSLPLFVKIQVWIKNFLGL